MLLNDYWVIELIREDIIKFLEFKGNENTNFQNLWDTAKAVLSGKFIAMSAYNQNMERSQIINLMLDLKLPEKQAKPKLSRRGKIIKIRARINQIEIEKNTYKESKKQKASS
jgi:hypothetical protein